MNLENICKYIGCSGLTKKCPGNHGCSILKKILKEKGKDYVRRNNSKPSDLYYTPFSLPWTLLEHEQFKNCLEPAAGDMRAIIKAASIAPINPIVFEYDFDISDPNEDNFFDLDYWYGDIWTNPPFSLWDDFVLHSKKITPKTSKICLLGKTNFLGCKGRAEKGVWNECSKLYVFNRYVDYRTPYREDGLFHVGNLCTGWFVWEHGYKGNIELIRLNVQKYAKLGQYKS